MYLPDNVQNYLRNSGTITVSEVAKKEGDLFVAVNVQNQQRRIISVDGHLIETMTKQVGTPSNASSGGRGILKG